MLQRESSSAQVTQQRGTPGIVDEPREQQETCWRDGKPGDYPQSVQFI